MTSPSTLQQILSEAVAHHQAGRLVEAEKLYRQVLAADSRNADSLHLLGLIALQQRRYDVAAERIGRAIQLQEGVSAYHSNLGVALLQQGHLAAAQAKFERALDLSPSYAEARFNLGLALEGQDRFDEARRHFAHAQALKPGYADAQYNQALALQHQGRNAELVPLYRRTLALHPGHVEACNNLGVALQNLGRLDEAAAQFRQALALDPANANASNNLASALQLGGDIAGAMAAGERALALHDNAKTRRVLVECLKRIDPAQIDAKARALLSRALAEVWARPVELAPAVIAAIKQGGTIAAWLDQPDRFSMTDLARITEDALMVGLLRSVPICDPQLERLFTGCRAVLLNEVNGNREAAEFAPAILDLACALADQGFVNEYVFACSEDETSLALDLERRLATALGQGQTVPMTWFVTLAAYRPLTSVQGVERLMEQPWPAPVDALLRLQVGAPLEERRYHAEIECLTPVSDSVSLAVRQQYEENPYPRWLKVPEVASLRSLDEMVVNHFPRAPFRPMGARVPDILIAGCGTGQHSISTARLFPTASVLAIDLSRASLAYAMRKSRELGLQNVQYAQADILELGGIGRQFDLIESSGVLHHLGDPFAGLRALTSLLRPNGLMKLALYSEIARKPIVEVRRLIAERGYAADPEGIRRCRQEIQALPDGDPRRKVLTFSDFYSMSECRDLLFHAQEHRLTLPVIQSWLESLGLAFRTFDVPPEIDRTFGWRFPDPAARTDLACWHLYEQDNPNTFAAMYQFWVQKSES